MAFQKYAHPSVKNPFTNARHRSVSARKPDTRYTTTAPEAWINAAPRSRGQDRPRLPSWRAAPRTPEARDRPPADGHAPGGQEGKERAPAALRLADDLRQGEGPLRSLRLRTGRRRVLRSGGRAHGVDLVDPLFGRVSRAPAVSGAAAPRTPQSVQRLRASPGRRAIMAKCRLGRSPSHGQRRQAQERARRKPRRRVGKLADAQRLERARFGGVR